MARLLPVVVGLLAAGAFAAGLGLRGELGLEWSTASVRGFVRDLGVAAPLGFVGLVALRQFLLIPSAVALTAGGLLFGAGLGTLLGGVGIVLSACLLFVLARAMGGDWVRARMEARFPRFRGVSQSAGPALVGFMTAHPMGMMTPFHLAAGISGIRWIVFLMVVGLAGPFRAGTYSLLGAHLLTPTSPGFWLATGILVAAALLPIAYFRLRARARSAQ